VPLGKAFPLKAVRASYLLPVVPAVLGASILLSEADNLLRRVLPMPAEYTYMLSNLVGEQASLWGSLLALVVVAPVGEELLFRGLILNGFLSRYSVRKAIVASALLFGAFHLNPWQFVGATLAGLLFGWWYVQTRSLIPCIVGHSLFNGVPFVLARVLHVQVPGFSGGADGVVLQPVWFDLSGLLLVGVGLWMLARALRNAAGRERAGDLSPAHQTA
jgi:hypothetical protein